MLVAVEAQPVGVGQQRPGLDAQQGVVGLGVALMGVVAVVGGEHRGLDLPRDLEQQRVRPPLLGHAVVLELDEEVVAPEDVLEAGGLLQRHLLLALEQRLQHVSAEAAGGGDQPVGVLFEELPVGPGLVPVALQVGLRRDLDEVAVPGLVLGQQDGVVVELLALAGVTAGVVGSTAAVGPLVARLVGQVDLGADDRLDPGVVAALVEVEDAVHVAVVGDPERRLPVGGCGRDHVVEPRRPVEHRVLGVHVEMGERIPHAGSRRRRDRRVDRSVDGMWTNHTPVISNLPERRGLRQTCRVGTQR